jgi:hypothetical protein
MEGTSGEGLEYDVPCCWSFVGFFGCGELLLRSLYLILFYPTIGFPTDDFGWEFFGEGLLTDSIDRPLTRSCSSIWVRNSIGVLSRWVISSSRSSFFLSAIQHTTYSRSWIS